jgi:hypothetical protein
MKKTSKPMQKNPALQSILSHLAAETVRPGDLDLWPSIRQRLAESTRSQAKETPMNTPHKNGLRLRLVGAAASLVLVLALLFATPQGQALAQNVLRFFTRANSDNLPVQPWQLTPLPTPGTPTPDPESILDAHQSVAEVEQLSGYKVLQPSHLPDILTFVGASYQPSQGVARIFYRDVDTNGLVFAQGPVRTNGSCKLCESVGASAAIESVQINASTGEYVEGVWNLTDQGPVWVSDPYQKTLRWQADGKAFELRYMGQPDSLTKDELIAIAQSIQP